MIAARQEPQALRGFVEQLRLWQDAAADGHDGVGGQDKRPFQFLIKSHRGERSFGLAACEPRCAGAGQFTAFRRLIDVGGAERIGFDTGLIDKRQPTRRAGGQGPEILTSGLDHLNR